MKGKLRIAQLAPLAEAVPPPGYGGSELVVSLLTEELVRRGHDVTLFASQESVSGARLVACAPQALRRGGVLPTRWPAYELAAVLQAEAMQDRFDIVHNHMGYLALPLLRHFRTAVVSTNHNLVSDYAAPVYMACKDLPYVSISEAYRQGNYGQHLNYIATIHNGIDVDSYRCDRDSERPYILFLGRLCPEKGAVEAIQIAQAVAMPIKLAGKVDERDAGYYAAQIDPLVNGRDVEYLGEVSLAEKVDLYRHAHCLVMPIAFDEPFGLVMAEAMASGAPVLVLRRGAAPEVVEHGVTGLVADTVAELIESYPAVERMDRDACRKRASDLFSKEKMADAYEQVYYGLCR